MGQKPLGMGRRGFQYVIYYYTPLPLNLANKQATSNNNNKHVTVPFWPLPLPMASGLTLL